MLTLITRTARIAALALAAVAFLLLAVHTAEAGGSEPLPIVLKQ